MLPLTSIPGIGPTTAQALERLNIHSIEDLLWHFPFRYDDLRLTKKISDAKIGERVTIEATIELIASRRSPRKRVMLTEGLVSDDTGSMKVIWFNQPFLTKNLKPNDRVRLTGRVESGYGQCQLTAPEYDVIGTQTESRHSGRLVPVYPSTSRITQKSLRTWIVHALKHAQEISDPVPEKIRGKNGLRPLRDVLHAIHFPKDEQDRDSAIHRLKFDELFLFHVERLKQHRVPQKAQGFPFDQKSVQEFVHALPFILTNSQRKAAWDIVKDLEKSVAMNRLLSGDVGSGKTVVAAIAAFHVLTSGAGVALMAPTELLARQHFFTLKAFFAEFPFPIALWTHTFHETSKEKGDERPTLLIGTHALLNEHAPLRPCGLVIIDEQHRFGVRQRDRLRSRGTQEGFTPHFLSLTATPIPRSLALTLANDIALSRLPDLPKDRKPTMTRIAPPHHRDAMYGFVEKEVAKGRQAFVLAPLIDPSDTLCVSSATALHAELSLRFRNLRIGLIHGKLKGKEKDAALLGFSERKTDVLVATPVVEVGIDIPNATVMVIEGAERFGLSQLHQIRGRVGRSEHQSYCFLYANSLTDMARKRLSAVAETTDGLKLAELDLALRGPGDLVGLEQSGFLDFRFASFADTELLERTRTAAEQYLTTHIQKG